MTSTAVGRVSFTKDILRSIVRNISTVLTLEFVDPRLETLLTFASASRDCVAIVDNVGPSEIWSWYNIWEEMVAVEGMCVRQGLEGQAFGHGELISFPPYSCRRCRTFGLPV